jgi:hypothetical protein
MTLTNAAVHRIAYDTYRAARRLELPPDECIERALSCYRVMSGRHEPALPRWAVLLAYRTFRQEAVCGARLALFVAIEAAMLAATSSRTQIRPMQPSGCME